jgi:hypothetical protein
MFNFLVLAALLSSLAIEASTSSSRPETPQSTGRGRATSILSPGSFTNPSADEQRQAKGIIETNYQECVRLKYVSSPIEYLKLINDDIMYGGINKDRTLHVLSRMIHAIVAGKVWPILGEGTPEQKNIIFTALTLAQKIDTRVISAEAQKPVARLDTRSFIANLGDSHNGAAAKYYEALSSDDGKASSLFGEVSSLTGLNQTYFPRIIENASKTNAFENHILKVKKMVQGSNSKSKIFGSSHTLPYALPLVTSYGTGLTKDTKTLWGVAGLLGIK